MLNPSLEIRVSLEDVGQRIDKFLSSLPEIRTRTKAEFLISQNFVTINGKFVKPSYCLKSDDLILVQFPVEKQKTLKASDIPLDIIYEDRDVLVVNKPAGLVVHPGAGHQDGTLVNALLHHTQDLSMRFNEERPGIVHRIDKETSGLLVIAKNDQSHEFLVQEFQNRNVHRIYKAICFGIPHKHESRIESNIGRCPTDRKKFSTVKTNGKWSATRYKVLKSQHNLSRLELKLETGRTHQIRVHMSELGHPLVGDSLYGATKKIKSISSEKIRNQIHDLNRFLLHAEQLGFTHPRTRAPMEFQVDWPIEIKSLIEQWGLL